MYVCLCKGVTDRQIRKAIQEGASRMRDLRRDLGVCSECGKCGECARDLLRAARPVQPAYAVALAVG